MCGGDINDCLGLRSPGSDCVALQRRSAGVGVGGERLAGPGLVDDAERGATGHVGFLGKFALLGLVAADRVRVVYVVAHEARDPIERHFALADGGAHEPSEAGVAHGAAGEAGGRRAAILVVRLEDVGDDVIGVEEVAVGREMDVGLCGGRLEVDDLAGVADHVVHTDRALRSQEDAE